MGERPQDINNSNEELKCYYESNDDNIICFPKENWYCCAFDQFVVDSTESTAKALFILQLLGIST